MSTSSPPNAACEGERPSEADVLQHLNRILNSDLFAPAPKQRRLLQYLVVKSLEGASAELKEYTIGAEAFGKGAGFDPRLDPIVRVEAGRLRARLQRYHEQTPAGHRIRIELPKGSYVPRFQPVDLKRPSVPEPAAVHRAQQRWRRHTLRAAAAVCALTVLILWARSHVTDANSSNFVQFSRITVEEARCSWPAFSPDGKFLVYARRQSGHWNLYRRRLGTLDVRQLLPSSATDNYQPAYSPADGRIAFRSDRDGGGIFLLRPDTDTVTRLTRFGFSPSWSPDGSQIVFASESFLDPAETESIRPSSLYIVDVRSRKVRSLPPPVRDALQPAWSPHGETIAYWGTAPGGKRNLWVVPANASSAPPAKPVRVTDDTFTDWDPVWSPDGRYLYFSSDRGGSMNLWRVRIDERSGAVLGSPEAVTTPSSYSGWIALAHGGKRLAYVRRLVSSRLYRVPFDVNGTVQVDEKVPLTAGEQRVREPDMSPDGKWIVVRMEDPQEDLALLRPDGSGLHRITDDPFSDRSPHWSPNGKRIIFLSNRSGTFELWSIRPDGSQLRRLTNDGSLSFCWAPNGALIGYPENARPVSLIPANGSVRSWGLPAGFVPLAWSPDHYAVVGRIPEDSFGRPLYIYRPATRDLWQIAANAPFPSTVWLRDSIHLLFSQNDGIYVANLRDRSVHSLMPIPEGNMHYRFTISHDEHTLFFVLSGDREDIWIGRQKG